jgi:hypothetical protein
MEQEPITHPSEEVIPQGGVGAGEVSKLITGASRQAEKCNVIDFMKEVVPVYEQRATHTSPVGIITECIKLNSVPRIEFYRSFLRRFAHDVCGCSEALSCTEAALNCLEGLNAIQALDMFTDWLFPTVHDR